LMKLSCPQPSLVIDPARRRRRRMVAGVVAAALLVGSFGAGRMVRASAECAEPNAQRHQLEVQLAASQRQIEELEQRLVNARLGTEVDRQVVEQLRQEMKSQQQAAANLREQVVIYKGLLVPKGSNAGFGIRSWTLSPQGDGRYHYRLVMQQLTDQQVPVAGDVAVAIAGIDAQGQEKVLALQELSRQHRMPNIQLSFTYFQIVEGEMELPVDFNPQRVQVLARASRPKALQVEKRFTWEVQEDESHVGKGEG
jgi:hypothetical protein